MIGVGKATRIHAQVPWIVPIDNHRQWFVTNLNAEGPRYPRIYVPVRVPAREACNEVAQMSETRTNITSSTSMTAYCTRPAGHTGRHHHAIPIVVGAGGGKLVARLRVLAVWGSHHGS